MISLRHLWLLPFLITGAAAVEVGDRREVTVTGTIAKDLAPDGALLSVAVETIDAATSKARARNRAAVEALITRLAAAGVKPEQISRSTMTQGDNWDYGSSGRSRAGFICRTGLSITVTDLARVDVLIDAIAADDAAAKLASVTWTRSDEISQRAEIRLRALAAARAKADALATAAGCTLGAPRTIAEQPTVPWPWGPTAYNGIQAGTTAPTATTVDPTQIRIEAGLTVTYDLVPLPQR